MKTPLIIVCVLGCLLAIGCRTNPKITMLEQECRMHEDRIYALQDKLSMTQSALSDEKQENDSLRKQDAGSSNRFSSGASDSNAPTNVNVTLPGTGAQEVSPDAFENMGGASSTPSDPNALPPLETPAAPPKKWNPSSGDSSAVESVPHGKPVKKDIQIKDGKVLYRQEGPQLRGDSREVKEITISKMMTGGVNADGQTGDEGIFVVVEPRDAEGRLVPAIGPISIVAFDPALPKGTGLTKWNFSEKEVAGQFRRSGSAEGFHLEVRWPGTLPRHEQLKLYVRYTTADERKLYAEAPIQIALTPKRNTLVARPAPRRLDTDPVQGWSPKPSTAVSPRVASVPSRPMSQSIPPASKTSTYTKRPVSRPHPVWSPKR